MPRRNENAFHGAHEKRIRQWGYRDPISWNPLLSKSLTPNSAHAPRRMQGSPEPNMVQGELRTSNYSTIKTTPEQIVRDYRKSIKHREDPILGPIGSLKVERQVHVQAPKKSIIRTFIDRINWGIVFNLACAALAGIAIVYIFGFIIFGPFKK